MNREEKEALLDEVADALGEMVECTCASMRPLWLIASQQLRSELSTTTVQRPEYPNHLIKSGKPTRSKYTALANWRHSVVWRKLLDAVQPRNAEAVTKIYFNNCDDEPPYSHSQKTSVVTEDVGALRLKAREGCWASLERLSTLCRTERGTNHNRAEFLKLGLRKTLLDVLKLDQDDNAQDRWDKLERGEP